MTFRSLQEFNKLIEKLGCVRIEPDSGCWIWLVREGKNKGQEAKSGRPSYYKKFIARQLLEIKLGREMLPFPQEVACHTCDRGSCVNPDHLWVGTQTDNHADMVSKGRARGGHGNSEVWRGVMAPRWQSGRTTVNCFHCGTEMETTRFEAKRVRQQACSRECAQHRITGRGSGKKLDNGVQHREHVV